jgi:hypothetical protein
VKFVIGFILGWASANAVNWIILLGRVLEHPDELSGLQQGR